MNSEIKEILDRLKEDLYIPMEDNREYKLLDKGDDKLLLDYITNLQEELEEEKRIEQASLDTINNLQEELKSANESITWWQNRFNTKNDGFKSTVEELCETTEKLEELEFKHKQLKDLDKIQKAYKELQEENEKLKKELNTLKISEEEWLDETLGSDENEKN